MERFQPLNEATLREIQRLQQPTPTSMFQEWREERFLGKYHAGFVLGMVLIQENPQYARVFYDGGRRRKVENKNKIILEGVDVPIKDLLTSNIKVGDLVQADWHFDRLTKIASLEDLKNQGIFIPVVNFDWQEVAGALY